MTFDPFVLPFSIGLLYLLVVVTERFRHWFVMLPPDVKKRVKNRIAGPATLKAGWEIIREGLFHRNLWRRNKLLGYMHMSFALGWFLLIVIGNIESRFYSQMHVNPPYYPIFLKFFVHDSHVLPFELTTIPGFFRFTMDMLLLFVLSGLVLALFKRTRSRWFGMSHTTRHNTADRIALTALWLIFPFRLLAESFTAGCFGGGSFLTNTLGSALAAFLPEEHLYYPFWWAYSFSLGIFFMLLPYSRYMHIPAEIAYILLKHWGGDAVKKTRSYYECGLQACSRCGVCLDQCQVATAGGTSEVAPVYFIRELRAGRVAKEIAENCLVCGRCQDACPVGIGLLNLRLWARQQLITKQQHTTAPSYTLPETAAPPEVVWFAGCMSHLTPAIIRSMQKIFEAGRVKYKWLDADGSICCGRPALLTGRTTEARSLIEANRQAVISTGAPLLVTNCPICYKVFSEEYHLPVKVMHHTTYFLSLIQEGRINTGLLAGQLALHIPCELGRNSAEAESLENLTRLLAKNPETLHKSALCCGGSLGSLSDYDNDKKQLCTGAGKSIAADADITLTACPLCKKSIARHTQAEVKDVAEIMAEALH